MPSTLCCLIHIVNFLKSMWKLSGQFSTNTVDLLFTKVFRRRSLSTDRENNEYQVKETSWSCNMNSAYSLRKHTGKMKRGTAFERFINAITHWHSQPVLYPLNRSTNTGSLGSIQILIFEGSKTATVPFSCKNII